MKYKKLTPQQIIISIDRLTRFKHPEEKYLRVFKDIIVGNLIEPKFKKQELEALGAEKIKTIAQEIFNTSVINFFPPRHPELVSASHQLNKKIFDYENSCFKLSPEAKILVNNQLDFQSALRFMEGDLPANLKWLKNLIKNDNAKIEREKKSLRYPLEKVVIVEGITEEILLPKFAKLMGFDFDKAGILIISAGGKNQVVKLFYKLVEDLKLPIFILLDKDAKDNTLELKHKLRAFDKIHLIEKGEFEDVLPLNLIKRTINNHFKNLHCIKLEDLRKEASMVKNLENVFKQKGEFKKAEFAQLVGKNIKSKKDLTPEVVSILNDICLSE